MEPRGCNRWQPVANGSCADISEVPITLRRIERAVWVWSLGWSLQIPLNPETAHTRDSLVSVTAC